MNTNLSRTYFDTSMLPEDKRFDIWCASIAPLVEAELAPGVAENEFFFRSDFSQLGQLLMGKTVQRGIGLYRYNGAGLVPGTPEVFFLQTYLRGGFTGHNGEQPMTVAEMDVVLVDALHPLETRVAGDEEILSLVIPRQVLLAAIRGRHMPVPRIFPGQRADTVLLRQLLIAAWEQIPVMQAEETLVIESMLLGVLAGVLKADGMAQAVADAGFASLRAYVEQHLDDPALDVDVLSRQFHMSRAAIYRLFKPMGGVASFMQRRRLERCHADLLSAWSGDTVSIICQRWGFVSEAHFSRVYRRSYGVSPGETLSIGEKRRR